MELTSLVLLKWFVAFSVATERNCTYYQDVVPEQTYYIYNNDYPNFYRPSTPCQWNVRSPPDTVVVLNCEIDIPAASKLHILDHHKTFSFRLSIAKQTDFPFRPQGIKILAVLEATVEIIPSRRYQREIS